MQSPSRVHRITTGVASLATIVALTAVVPAALWKLAGWPLPAALPSFHDLAQALSQNQIADSTLVKALALVGWAAWLQIAASTLVETVAWARGRAAPRLRFTGSTQTAMCKLIASATLLLASPHPTTTASFAGPIRPRGSVPAAVEIPAAILVRADTSAHEAERHRSTAPAKTYTVARYDSLWGIAQKQLADPLRWRDIFTLNRGKDQHDGQVLENPQLIIPGWILTMPTSVTAPKSPHPALDRPRLTAKPATARHTRQPTDDASAPLPMHVATTPTSTTPVPTTAPVSAVAPTTGRDRPLSDPTEGRIDPALLIGGGLAAASVVALLDRLRRVQRRRRRVSRSSDPALADVERRLRRAADLEGAGHLNLALRAFAAGLASKSPTPTTILAVRVGDGQVEILSDRPPARPPKGFVATDDPRGWITDPDVGLDELRDIGTGAAAPLPALVTFGDVEGGQLLIDIESAGTLTVDGDPERVGAFIRRVAVELATSLWVDHVDVLAVGTFELDTLGAQRLQHFSDIDTALDELDAVARNIGDALQSVHCARTLEARVSEHPDDGWIPTILVCTEPIGHELLARIREITGEGGRGTGAIVYSEIPATWHAALSETDLLLAPLGIHVDPALLDLPKATALDELVTDLAVGEPIAAVDTALPAAVTTELIAEPYADPPFELEVRVLGPVQIVGSRVPLERRDCIELATFLALHPQGASDEQLITALWPDRTPARSTFNTAVSTTRSRLGRASDGTAHLPRSIATAGIYQLGPLVTTDLARFTARVAYARRCAPATAIETLQSAMDLVRGKPFDGARGYEWAFSESLIAHIEATIADAAHQLALLYLDSGDAHQATVAAVQGLAAAPADEILFRDRMLACDLAGNPAGVETVMDELCEVVEALEPYDEIHPETLALYERISHRKRTRPTVH